MLEWFGALLIILLVAAVIWPASKYLGLPSQSTTTGVQGLGQLRREWREKVAEKCIPNRGGDGGAAGQGVDGSPGESPAVALICKPSALANYLLKHCVTFCKLRPWPWWNWRASPLLQSLFGICWPHDCSVHFVRDHLQMSDDGIVALDWAVAASASVHKRRRTSSNSTSPILIIIPNSFGKITRNVVKLCEVALTHGYLPVIFNRRGHNGTPLSTLKLQQFGDPADLREAVRYIRYRQPAGRLYAVSESTGSGLLLSYLGECGSSSYVTAAACLSPVFRCQSWFEGGGGGGGGGGFTAWPLHWALLLYQKTWLSRYRTVLGDTVQTDALFSSATLRTMEELLFCHHPHAHSSPPSLDPGSSSSSSEATTTTNTSSSTGAWESYWERNDPLRDIDEVAIPVLCVCSQDDPVRGEPESSLPLELFESNPHFFLLLTSQGGHCGFYSAPGGGAGGESSAASVSSSWSHEALLDFLRATSDFFAAEERAKQQAARRRGLSGSGKALRHRTVSTCRKVPACSHNIHAIYSWQRSYTR